MIFDWLWNEYPKVKNHTQGTKNMVNERKLMNEKKVRPEPLRLANAKKHELTFCLNAYLKIIYLR